MEQFKLLTSKMQAQQFPLLINESIFFDYTPPPSFAGHYNRHPFRVKITSSNDNTHIVDLQTRYSRSYDPQFNLNKWSFLRPESKFLDLDGNKISSITTKDTKYYLDDNNIVNTVSGTFIGVVGEAEFYYIDDIYNFDLTYSNQSYSMIVATLQTSEITFADTKTDHIISSDYSNSKAIACQPHIFYYREPDYIKISENGINDFHTTRWTSIKQPVVFTINWNKNYNSVFDGNSITPVNYQSNFCHYVPYSSTNVILFSASTLGLSSYFDDDLVFSYKNSDGYIASGYLKTFLNVPSETTLNVVITAVANFDTPVLNGNNFSPKLWLSNPETGLVSIVEYNNPEFFPNEDSKNLQKAQIFNFDVPVIQNTNFNNDVFATRGFHGINSIAVLPPPNFQAWACDSELNYLYKFGSNGNILSAIDINNDIIKSNNLGFLVDKQVSPNSIVIDGNYNIWMTLYDTVSVLKLDSNGRFLFAINPTNQFGYNDPPTNITNQLYLNNQPTDLVKTQNFIEPTFIDTDTSNNVWITYSNYASGYLVKYNQEGSFVDIISYPAFSSPQDLITDIDDNVWVALSNNTWQGLCTLEKRRTDGLLLSSFSGFKGLNNLALDLNQNIWFTYDYNSLATIDTKTGVFTDLNISRYTDFSKYPVDISNIDETALEGIGCDLKGRIYVLNSIENQIYIFDSNSKKFINKFYVNPQGFTFYNKKESGDTFFEYNVWNKSLQAKGDWIGTRWINKYFEFHNSFLSTTDYVYIVTNDYKQIFVQLKTGSIFYDAININISGTSYPMNFYNKNDVPKIYKINENFDLGEQMKSLAFMPSLNESTFLFDTVLKNTYGSKDHDDLGIKSYEKISNFVLNTTDVDTCEIDKIYNFQTATDQSTNDYKLNYPLEIKRLINLFSINQSRLWGSINKNENNFSKPSNEGISNRGNLIDSNNYQVSAGVPLILKNKSLNEYTLIPTGPINGSNNYSIEVLVDFLGLGNDWKPYYEFYEFVSNFSQTYNDNIIDWNNPQTTINKNLTSSLGWIGDEQLVEQMLSYQLYEGLGLLGN